MRIVKVEPSPSLLRTRMLPPWSSTICRAIASPRPDRQQLRARVRLRRAGASTSGDKV